MQPRVYGFSHEPDLPSARCVRIRPSIHKHRLIALVIGLLPEWLCALFIAALYACRLRLADNNRMGHFKLRPALAAMAWLALSASVACAGDDVNDRATPRGIRTVCVVVEVIHFADVEKSRLTSSMFESDLEGALSDAGLRTDAKAIPCVYLKVRPLQALAGRGKRLGLYAVDFSLDFFQTVSLARDPSVKTFAPTWSVENMATIPAGELSRAAREITADLTQKFVAAYRSVNP